MKHFRLILTIIRLVTLVLFVADIIFMMSLYNSIKKRYIDDVEQCLRRADLIELIDRLTAKGYGKDGVIEVWLGLEKSDVGVAKSPEELLNMNYSQGYKRLDRQLISVITKYLHDSYEENIGSPDMGMLEEVFRRELNFSGFYPEEVYIISGDGSFEYSSDLWEIEHRVDGELIYKACISPLTRNIFDEMSGVIAVTGAIALVFTIAFGYLLYVINRQKTIEEMKDDFTNNMTHELKTPIAIAYAANDSLLQFPDPSDEARTRKYLTAALEQLTKLTGLVDNILAMSMERSKHLTLTKEEIRLRPFLESIIRQQKIKVQKEFRIRLECQDDAMVKADPTHLSNILGNLIDNSVKYSGEKVNIVVRADSSSISVSDDGIGIPRKNLPEIFKRFYRVPSGNRQNVRGYGIGLFYVKSIVEKHGWNISVESEVGIGTTFLINFTRR